MKKVIATAASVLAITSTAEAQVAEPPKLSKRPGCEGITGTECNHRIHRIHRLGYKTCNTWDCARRVKKKRIHRARVRFQHEWKYWTTRYIPSCTWLGESGHGPQFAPWRYSVRNTQGSGAYGKFQMMPGTYHSYARYHDWSPLDQEIAAHRLYWSQGTSPWAAC